MTPCGSFYNLCSEERTWSVATDDKSTCVTACQLEGPRAMRHLRGAKVPPFLTMTCLSSGSGS